MGYATVLCRFPRGALDQLHALNNRERLQNIQLSGYGQARKGDLMCLGVQLLMSL